MPENKLRIESAGSEDSLMELAKDGNLPELVKKAQAQHELFDPTNPSSIVAAQVSPEKKSLLPVQSQFRRGMNFLHAGAKVTIVKPGNKQHEVVNAKTGKKYKVLESDLSSSQS